jgi:DNA-binding transcriptional regulator YiaG
MKGVHAMSNIAKVLKAEIMRISRKEVKGATQGIGKSNTWLRKVVADLKKRLLLLEKENKRLVVTMKKYQIESPEKPDQEEGKKARLTSRGIRSLRKKLRLSQLDFGKLLGTTAHCVYLWEKKDGALSLRDRTKAAILSIRVLGAKEAREKLDEAGGKLKKARVVATRTKKTR